MNWPTGRDEFPNISMAGVADVDAAVAAAKAAFPSWSATPVADRIAIVEKLRDVYKAGAEEGLTPNVLSAVGSAQAQLGRLGQAERTLRAALDQDDRSVPVWSGRSIRARDWRRKTSGPRSIAIAMHRSRIAP